jgi:ubiquinone biosynthesis accessory factor UbiJ
MPGTPAWLAVVEAALERGIRGSARARALAGRLQDTALQVEIKGVIRVRASVHAGDRLTLSAVDLNAPHPETVNATISGSPFALWQLAKGGTSGGAASTGGARAAVRGDAEIANLYRQLFAAARPEPEEELARLFGDPAARQLSLLAEHTLHWLRTVRRTAGENIAEYLQEESRDLVNKTELDEFLEGVDVLRERADRVAARLAHLEQRLKDSV